MSHISKRWKLKPNDGSSLRMTPCLGTADFPKQYGSQVIYIVQSFKNKIRRARSSSPNISREERGN